MTPLSRSAMFAPFSVRNFRFQWSADLLASWAFEMENIILSWYILVQTQSVLLLTIYASLQFIGTLVAPIFGLIGDRIGYRNILCLMRVCYAALAAVIALSAWSGVLSPILVLVVAGLAGLIRPSDTGLRNVMIGGMLPYRHLMGAIGLARITVDSARVAGALAGAGLAHTVGIIPAYGVIVVLYVLSTLLMLGVRTSETQYAVAPASRASPWRDLADAARAVWEAPPQLAAMILAFLVNLTAYPFTLGLLPYVAREVYGVGETGLGYLSASVGFGAILASLLLSWMGSTVRPARMMLVFSLAWHALVTVLGLSSSLLAGAAVLLLNGLASMLCLLPLSVLLLREAPPALRGRIMGMRTQAVYGLPVGLMLSGPLIESVGFRATATLYGLIGIACTSLILIRWYAHLWPSDAAANRASL